jgi:hypothetical protein
MVREMARASSTEREYFARIGRQNRALEDETPPASLAEMFDRLERIRRSHGSLAEPGAAGGDEGDLPGHLAFLERMRTVKRRGANRP